MGKEAAVPERSTRVLGEVEMPASKVPVIARADVVVVGGGNAGVAAAVAAARTGASTLLVERYGYLGGMTVGTFNTGPGVMFDPDGKKVVGGIGWEIEERMAATGGAIRTDGAQGFVNYPEHMKLVAQEIVMEAGVDLLLHSWFCRAIVKDGRITSAIMLSKNGLYAVEGKAFVDATGDADLAAGAGVPFDFYSGPTQQQVSVDMMIGNVDAKRAMEWGDAHAQVNWGQRARDDSGDMTGLRPPYVFIISQPEGYEKEQREGFIRFVGAMPSVKSMIRRSCVRIQGNGDGVDATDVRGLTYTEVVGRRGALEHLEHLRKNIPGFGDAFVVGQSPLGVRESRRIKGDYTITLDDWKKNARFPDVIGLNARGLDRHLSGTVFEYEHGTGHHDIPYRAMVPKGIDNLLVAGRCISVDHEAHASVRGMPACWVTGHASGTAAALAAKRAGGEARKVDIGELQKTLLEQGAILTAEPKP